MSNREIATAVFKLWGTWWLIVAIASLAETVMVIQALLADLETDASQRYLRHYTIAFFATRTTFGSLLVWKGRRLSELIFPDSADFRSSINASEIAAIAFGSLGIYLVVDGTAGLLPMLYAMVVEGRPLRVEDLLANVVYIAAGFMLFLGHDRLRSLWQRFHSMAEESEGDKRDGRAT